MGNVLINPQCKYFPWKSMKKFRWNSMEIDVLIFHRISLRIFMEFHGGFSHGKSKEDRPCYRIIISQHFQPNFIVTGNNKSRFTIRLLFKPVILDCSDLIPNTDTYTLKLGSTFCVSEPELYVCC